MSRSATWTCVCSPRLNEPSVKRTRRPPATLSAPTATGSTVSGRTSHGTEALVALPWRTSRRPKTVPGLSSRMLTVVGVPATSDALGGWAVAPLGRGT